MKRRQVACAPTADVAFGRVEDAAEDYHRRMLRDGWDTCEHDNVRRWCPECNPACAELLRPERSEGRRGEHAMPTVAGIENAVRLWREGFDSWRNVPRAEQRAEYESVIRAIGERLNDCQTIAALVSRYYENNDWCLDIAKRLYPEKPYTWRLSIVEDAAYWLRLLELDAGADASGVSVVSG